jgi:uncharacterized protein YlxW (UPF0749 family)
MESQRLAATLRTQIETLQVALRSAEKIAEEKARDLSQADTQLREVDARVQESKTDEWNTIRSLQAEKASLQAEIKQLEARLDRQGRLNASETFRDYSESARGRRNARDAADVSIFP